MSTTTLLVRQDQLATTRLVTTDDTPLAEGQVRVRVESFALTANNITYAALGNMLNYWQFFPTGDAGWGIVPVWGFGTVVQSLNPAVAVGERLYGYWPMASQAVLSPERVNPTGFSDGAAHRAGLHAVYNHYLRTNTDGLYRADNEDVQALLRPLFITSWLIDDFLADQQFFGAQRMLLSSASSKTAYGTAFQLAQRGGIEVIGLTSPGNVAFCESLGCYSRVVTYDALDQIDGATPSVYIDFAGSVGLRQRIHTHFTGLAYSCSVGASHVQDLGGAGQLPGPRPVMFFAPAQVKKRHTDWGAQGLNERLVAAWNQFSSAVSAGPQPWLVVQHHAGPEATQALFAAVLAGSGDPRAGHIATVLPR
ncbi:uncharacterized protein DUF2855 [Acidovorax sp. 69]|uniref:DUF2855 family protein n=1 Tax=Acidovorax sp. 69 TaxID=2035202 RepID=UPI000C250B51|nr:DUF2855 family protein [Acidovorax sp. 69]PJI99323.1 uncharacterized protein DUF2855 [Acidovorax sp. 69]